MVELWRIRKIVHWLMAVFIVIFIVTGFGITEYRLVESMTFGLLTKPLSFKIHSDLAIPLVVLFIIHLLFEIKSKKSK